MSLQQLKEQRPKNYSRYGQQLERLLHPIPTKSSSIQPIEVKSRIRQKAKPTFETIPREVKSPFTLFYSKEHQNLDYRCKYDAVNPNQPQIQFSKTKSMSFIDKATSTTLKEFSVDKNEQTILAHRDLQKSRKKLIHLQFDKQQERQLGPQRERDTQDSEIRFNNFQPESMKQRSHSIHSFRSYTSRKDLHESGNISYRSKEVSNVHTLDMNKIKKRWSITSLVPFNKLVDQIKLRSDRDCNPWLTKLVYNPKNTQRQSNSKFELQSKRKPNEVHSKYPLRICV